MGVSILERSKNSIKQLPEKLRQSARKPVFWAKALGSLIPAIFLGYVIYVNVLPFGFNKTYKLDIGAANDTETSDIYLEPSKDLSDRQTAPDGKPFRTLNGIANIILDPKAAIGGATITAKTDDKDISFVAPHITFDPSSVNWDYTWDFMHGVPSNTSNTNAFPFEGSTYFNGTARLEVANSADLFEKDPFTIYAEWKPVEKVGNFQQIIGHYNWEIVQNSDSVQFQVGRMNNATGTTYVIKYPVTGEFFDTYHNLVAVYSPAEQNGYIELFIDRAFAGRVYIGSDKIWKDYNEKTNLSFGWSPHNYRKSPYFKGYMKAAMFVKQATSFSQQTATFQTDAKENIIKIPVVSNGDAALSRVELYVDKR